MTPLTQQLEDKKKGCGKTFNNLICGESYDSSYKPTRFLYCPTCKAEIAILEQAIAEIKKRDKDIDELAESSTFALCALMKENKGLKDEMQKQKQNFIDIINSLGEIRGKSNDLQCIKLGESFSTNSVEWLKKELLKQLNQPNSERKE